MLSGVFSRSKFVHPMLIFKPQSQLIHKHFRMIFSHTQ
jgi:hypothetical protein